jgi:hypothetical protein
LGEAKTEFADGGHIGARDFAIFTRASVAPTAIFDIAEI